MKKKLLVSMLAAAIVASALTGCGITDSNHTEKSSAKTVKLDPENPVSLTVWHYYNGLQQTAFDNLVDEFNNTVGKDEGISVKSYSQGSVADLEKAITDAVDGLVGAEKMPDIFSSYADVAYTIEKKSGLADLSQYFTEEELSEYVDSYIQEGYFEGNKALYLFPVAKSTEIMMINKTDWEPFASATGVTLDQLSTLEGVREVAEKYYDWTDAMTPDVADDGKAFYGRDAMANYFIIGMKQQGKDLFQVKDGKVTVDTDKESIRRLWDNYYEPYIMGYFAAFGKFRSDDVKTGDILAYTGSTASAMYFPDKVEDDDESYAIDYIVQNAPLLKDGKNYKVQQGAGMAVSKSDEKHEYASSVFLKWFTQKEQNLRFVCESAYLPVRKDANTITALDQVVKENSIDISQKAYDCLKDTMDSFDKTEFYTSACFENSYDARQILEHNLSDKAAADKAAIDEKVASGISRKEAAAEYLTDQAFDQWYEEFCKALNASVEK